MLIVALMAIVLAVAITLLLARSIVRPLAEMTAGNAHLAVHYMTVDNAAISARTQADFDRMSRSLTAQTAAITAQANARRR